MSRLKRRWDHQSTLSLAILANSSVLRAHTHTQSRTHTVSHTQSIQCPLTLMRGLKARHTCARVIREDFIATLQATTLHYCTSLVTLLENSGFSKSGSGTTRTPSRAQGSSSLNGKKREQLPVFLSLIHLKQYVARLQEWVFLRSPGSTRRGWKIKPALKCQQQFLKWPLEAISGRCSAKV